MPNAHAAAAALSGAALADVRKAPGIYALMERLYADLLPYQGWRELVQNSLEAGATRIELLRHDPTWTATAARKRMVADNGQGMSPEVLARVTANLSASGKRLGLTANIGVGAKIALLPWNRHGVVYLSLRDGVESMAWIEVDEATSTAYFRDLTPVGLTPLYSDGDGTPIVFAPGVIGGVDWSATLPEFVRATGSGTCVVLLGNSPQDNTLAGDTAKEARSETTTTLIDYLDSRYFTLPAGVQLAVQRYVVTGAKQHKASAYGFSGRMANFAAHRGAAHRSGAVEVSTTVNGIEVPATVHWFLVDETLTDGKPFREWLDKGANAKHLLAPWVATVHAGEVFGRDALTSDRRRDYLHMGYAGITYKSVQQHTYLFVEPRSFDESQPYLAGAAMDTGRKGLAVYRNGAYFADLPTREWLAEFARRMPQPIQERLAAEASASQAAALDEDVFICDLFSEMSKMRAYAVKAGGAHRITPNTATTGGADGDTPSRSSQGGGPAKRRPSGKNGKSTGGGRTGRTDPDKATSRRAKVISLSRTLGSSVDAKSIEVFKSHLPRVEYIDAETFSDGHEADRAFPARWRPGAEGDPGVISINLDDPQYQAFLDVVAAEAGARPWLITDPSELDGIRRQVVSRAVLSGVVGALVREMTEGLEESPLAVSMACVGDATLMAHLRKVLDLRRPSRRRTALAS